MPRSDLGCEGGTTTNLDSSRPAIDLYPRVGDDRWSESSLHWAAWAFVSLGVAIRLIRLLLNHPLWGDECFIAANLVVRGFLGLIRPLDYQQVAPVLFLWSELAVVRLVGLSEWSLRLLPTACAIGSLFVLKHLAGRVARGMPMLLAVAILAVSLNPIRHGGEAKPYAMDFFASAVLLALAVEWWRRPSRSGWAWALAAVTLPAIGFSLPSVFVLGGISLAMLGEVWRGRHPRVVAAYLAFNAAIVVGVGVSAILYRGEGSAEVKAYMEHYWSPQFPPLTRPGDLVFWLIRAHTGHLFAYPIGGANGASLLTVAFAVLGAINLARRGRGTIVVACVAPLGLALVASAVRAYPYGESERLMQFEGPMICLLAGYGLAWAIGRLRQPGSYRKAALGLLGGFAVLGLATIGFDVARPYKTPSDLRAREFARWFWAEAGRDAELACVNADLGLDFEGGPDHSGRSADFATYRAIESPRHRDGLPLDWRKVTSGHPLRCVLYDGVPFDSPLFESWMARMARHYRVSDVSTFRVNAGHAPRSVSAEDRYTVLEFEPIGQPVDPAVLAREAIEATSRAGRGSLTLPGP
jgi:hypothetical protein